MGFRCGIVGLPNVGKSTLFNALTEAGIACANYPFCTIDPNVGKVPVPDPRLQAIANLIKPQAILPTSMEFVDIAGLVEGAASGQGLGNQFLAHIRETDAIVHVVRCFENSDIIHVANRVNPLADIATIDTELALADLDTVQKATLRYQKSAKGDPEHKTYLEYLSKAEALLNEAKPLVNENWSDEARTFLKTLSLLTLKPVLFVANVDDSGFQGNPLLEAVQRLSAERNAACVPVCAATEAELLTLDKDDQAAFLADMGLEEPGLHRLIRAGYDLLGLSTFFTAGVKEVRAWTVHKGASAPQAAGRIHTDFEHGFIRAEVMAYADFIAEGGEAGTKAAGKWRLEGKDYIVQEGDIMHFRFNT